MYLKGIIFMFLIILSMWEWTNMLSYANVCLLCCNSPKQWQILSRIFSRITSKVLVELSACPCCKLSSVVCLWRGGGGLSASAVCLASRWYLKRTPVETQFTSTINANYFALVEREPSKLWSWICRSKNPFCYPSLLKEVHLCFHPQCPDVPNYGEGRRS